MFERSTALTKSAAPATASSKRASQIDWAKPTSDDRDAPGAGGEAHAETLPANGAHPARDERGDQRAGEEGRVQEAEDGRAAAELGLRMPGKSALGIPKIIAFVSTMKIPSSTFRCATYRKPSMIDRRLGRSASGGRNRREQPDREQRGAEGGEVDPVGPGQAEDRDQDSGERGAGDAGQREDDVLDGDRGQQLVLSDEPAA